MFIMTRIGAVAIALATICCTEAFGQSAKDLAKPVRLQADGEFIDTGKRIAHSGPLLCDYDDDGLQDLLVGTFTGHIQVYRNIGTVKQPKLTSKGLLQAGEGVLKIKNW